MQAYLFDTNIWSKWFRSEPFILNKICQIDQNSPIYLSVIVWGEVIYGAKASKKFDFKLYRDFIDQSKPVILPLDKSVSEVYGELRASLYKKYPPNGKNKKHPEQLIDTATATEIGIDENDLWIVSQAIAYNLTLITNDKMQKIFSITSKELKYEIWA